MTDQWTDRLSEYLDNELTPGERQQLETHIAGCPACRETLDELKAVVARAGRLEDREPDYDLWPGVREAISRHRVVELDSRRKPALRFTFSLPQLVAAAAALPFRCSRVRMSASSAARDWALAPVFTSAVPTGS